MPPISYSLPSFTPKCISILLRRANEHCCKPPHTKLHIKCPKVECPLTCVLPVSFSGMLTSYDFLHIPHAMPVLDFSMRWLISCSEDLSIHENLGRNSWKLGRVIQAQKKPENPKIRFYRVVSFSANAPSRAKRKKRRCNFEIFALGYDRKFCVLDEVSSAFSPNARCCCCLFSSARVFRVSANCCWALLDVCKLAEIYSYPFPTDVGTAAADEKNHCWL